MLADLFWKLSTSYFSLGVDVLILLTAFVVGHFPLLKYLPGIGPYVPAARLVSVFMAGLICFLVGFRIADEREEVKRLETRIVILTADLEAAKKAAADEASRSTQIETSANEQHETDAQYIRSLALRPAPACLLDDGDLPERLRHGAAAGIASGGPARPTKRPWPALKTRPRPGAL